MGLPLCAAARCPSQNDCQGYITSANASNPETLPFVACCKVLCGIGGDKGILALQCGSASKTGAIFIVMYVMVLYILAMGMLPVGLFVKLKRCSFLISAFGTAIFGTTVTGIYVTYVTSSFTYLEAVVPAIGAMNIAVFSFFFSGFQYSIGLTYEAGPLVALIAGAFPIWRAILKTPGQYAFLRASNRLAFVMLLLAFIWVLHSVSFRIIGYRVQWRYEDAPTRKKLGEPVNMCYLLGALQGHPTWKTPVGQTTSCLLMCFAWAIRKAVRNDLKNHQRCEADWVLKWMYSAPPGLMTAAVVYIFLSALRGQNVLCTYVETVQAPGFWENPVSWIKSCWRDPGPVEPCHGPGRVGLHPGWQYYKNFVRYLERSMWDYVQVVALHRLGRNTFTIEEVPVDMVDYLDFAVGILAWLLAFAGLLMGFPVTMVMSYLARGFGAVLEWIGKRRGLKFVSWFVITTVSKQHAKSAKEVLTAAYVGPYKKDNRRNRRMVELRDDLDPADEATGRYVNLPYLLDNISHEELHALLHKPPIQVIRT